MGGGGASGPSTDIANCGSGGGGGLFGGGGGVAGSSSAGNGIGSGSGAGGSSSDGTTVSTTNVASITISFPYTGACGHTCAPGVMPADIPSGCTLSGSSVDCLFGFTGLASGSHLGFNHFGDSGRSNGRRSLFWWGQDQYAYAVATFGGGAIRTISAAGDAATSSKSRLIVAGGGGGAVPGSSGGNCGMPGFVTGANTTPAQPGTLFGGGNQGYGGVRQGQPGTLDMGGGGASGPSTDIANCGSGGGGGLFGGGGGVAGSSVSKMYAGVEKD
ncbi:hypothetical protein RQP46_007314 [Phenoliferia psychrophenolica]